MNVYDTPAGVSGRSNAIKKTAGSVHRVEIERADNGGYTVHTHYRPSKPVKDEPTQYHEPHHAVFEDHKSMLAHVAKCLDCTDNE